jgi:hypothetical protein
MTTENKARRDERDARWDAGEDIVEIDADFAARDQREAEAQRLGMDPASLRGDRGRVHRGGEGGGPPGGVAPAPRWVPRSITGGAGMTAPTEAEIRAYMESYLPDNWSVGVDDLRELEQVAEDAPAVSAAFEGLIDSHHVTDDDFGVFTKAHTAALQALMPAVSAALRPLMIEAQVRAAVRFFEHYPDAPLAKPEPVPA